MSDILSFCKMIRIRHEGGLWFVLNLLFGIKLLLVVIPNALVVQVSDVFFNNRNINIFAFILSNDRRSFSSCCFSRWSSHRFECAWFWYSINKVVIRCILVNITICLFHIPTWENPPKYIIQYFTHSCTLTSRKCFGDHWYICSSHLPSSIDLVVIVRDFYHFATCFEFVTKVVCDLY